MPGAGVETREQDLDRLLAAARGGNSQALGDVLAGCRDYLLFIANRELSPDVARKVGASDLVQDTLIEAQRDFVRFRGQTRGELLNWVRTILQHNLVNAHRQFRVAEKRRLDKEVGLSPKDLIVDRTGPPEQLAAAEDLAALDRAISQLPPLYRTVLQARYSESLSFAEIGVRLALGTDAARRLWAKAVLALKRELSRQS
jgi:RNA polymerase sigma-70 factor (ECF subfamily)